jgi:proteasome alpha subunit
MIDEPYRWVEAISNRREYIENELATGSPTIGLSFRDGILLLTFGRDRRKIFEIYDRIAIGAIGHPGDIERLRMMAIELASTEGFTRSAADVSLRRMVTYAFSPALKQAFEQIYGPPYLARILFAEGGPAQDEDLFVRLDYDGSMHASAMNAGKRRESFGAIAGTRRGLEQIEGYLREADFSDLLSALRTAIHAWGVGLYAADQDHQDVPEDSALKEFVKSKLEHYTVEAALLERETAESRGVFVEVPEPDLEAVLSDFR